MTSPSVSPPAPGPDGTDPVESVLAGIWAELLDLDTADLTPGSSFLRLGGDSVLAVRMAALVRKRLSVVLALSDVTVEITLARLADLVRRRRTHTGAVRELPLEVSRRADPAEPFPLMPLQQGYFVGQQGGWELSYDSAHFYADVGLTGVDGDEAADALTDALERLVEHQPTLRARVTPEGRQYVLDPGAPGAVPRLLVHDLRDAPADEVAATLARVREEMATSGPDPSRGPGLDIRLSLLPGDRGRLHTAMSLLVFDGWSSTVLNRELLTLSSDWNAVLPPLEIDFGDYVSALARLPETEAWAADRDWWWSRLDALPSPPALPLRTDPKDARPALMLTLERHLSPERWAALRRNCAERGVTPSTAMLTAFSVVLSRWAGHRSMLLNSLQLNRLPLHPDINRVVGAFASTMLIPMELPAGAVFADIAADTQRVFGEHAAHNLVSGVEVARELGRRLDTTRPVGPVVFQSTLGMDAALGEKHPASVGPLGEISFDDFYHQLRTPQVALEARVYELNDEMAVVFSLVEELFDPAEVDAAFTALVELAESLADGPGWDAPVELPEALDPQGAGLRLGLPGPDRVAEESGPLRGDTEQRVAEIWEELLDVPVLDRGADFFRLGGDSLLAVRALARLAGEAGLLLGVRDFLDAPTVAGVAAAARPAGETR
ncbi:condensation domain-containing protein [Actinorugispora endophytica]|uniref:Phosphopantetheine binding protein n=1 Tax=Actinorugispora endophytica TaxID=1605990 RepID=A0A4R6UT20_9ACTN|nr:condensation domain-containing protein [Actinorugispora endophytica]TDQ50272.1 phosphopantetheine binding protein [Actinorugispora endophytica]